MKLVHYALLSLCFIAVVSAKTKEFSIAGGEKITAAYDRGMPLPAEKAGIKIEVAGMMVGDGKLTFTFGFTTKRPLKKVVVEDVTEARAVPLVEDNSPSVDGTYWKGDAAPRPMARDTLPWLYARGDTTKVFRFTITLADQPQPEVLYQPSVYARAVKRQLLQMIGQ